MNSNFTLSFFSFLLIKTFLLYPIIDSEVNTDTLRQFWVQKQNNKRYYSIEVNGEKFNGKRDWEQRWNLIKNATQYKNKRILDLGSNIGVSSIFLKKYTNAKKVVGVESRAENIRSARILSRIFNVKIPFYHLNLNDDYSKEVLGTNYDIIICMSLYKWVEEKEKFLSYLKNFKEIIYEGHESNDIEIQRFRSIGFKKHKVLGPSSTSRNLILFRK